MCNIRCFHPNTQNIVVHFGNFVVQTGNYLAHMKNSLMGTIVCWTHQNDQCSSQRKVPSAFWSTLTPLCFCKTHLQRVIKLSVWMLKSSNFVSDWTFMYEHLPSSRQLSGYMWMLKNVSRMNMSWHALGGEQSVVGLLSMAEANDTRKTLI